MRPNETTSSFWNEDFSFNNKTAESQTSNGRISNLKRGYKTKSNKVMLTRANTGTIGIHTIIHHGSIDLTLNELKNIFKLKYEQRDDPPIDGIIFKLGVNEYCPRMM